MKRLFIITILALSLCLPAMAFDPYFFGSGLQKEWSFNAQQNNPLDARGKQGGDGTFTFAGTNRTYIDADGVMQTAGANVPVYEIVGGKKALRMEPAGANLLMDSRNIDDASTYWVGSGTGTGAQDATGVDGGANKATTITDADGAAHYTIHQQVYKTTTDVNPWCFSVYVKKTTGATTFPGFGIQNMDTCLYTINTNTGAMTAFSGNSAGSPNAGIIDTGGDWWRVWMTSVDDGTHGFLRTFLYGAVNADASATWATATQGSAIFDCAQLEYNKSFPSSYVDGAAATLGADIASDGDCSGGTLTTGAGWAHDAGNNEYDATASDADLTDAGILTANKVYRLKVVFANDGGGSFIPMLGGTSGTAIDANGTYYQYIIAGGTDLVFDATGLTGSIQSYEVKEHGTVRLTEEGALTFTLPTGIFSGNADGTIAVWWMPGFDQTDAGANFSIITTNSGSSATVLYFYNSGNALATYDTGSNRATVDPSFTKNNWYKVASTWTLGANGLKIGYDSGSGMTFGTTQTYSGAFTTTGNKIIFGLYLSGPQYYSDGIVFDRVLTTAQINAIGGSP